MREVFAVMHKDMNLMPRIHVKRPGVAMYTGIPGVGGVITLAVPVWGPTQVIPTLGRQRQECPCDLLAASLLDKLQTSCGTMSQHNKI